ncbi:PGBD4-like protein [Mya arenaria]|uniref:PGBD4-like protein n=1 Tax=Mya arenaria TaxID=6604 RepID=A0ABY7ETI4_MYAAR|nr:PGBD4-like protein [Mya arenaria]
MILFQQPPNLQWKLTLIQVELVVLALLIYQELSKIIMPRDRFNLIWHYLHLTDNQQPQETPDKLRKIRPMMTYLNDKFMNAYTPYGNVTVDESMVKFKGRLGFRQYLPSKPIKWGIKLWALAESTTGYLHRFQIYTGREEGVQGKGLSHRVVHELTNHLRFSNVRVFMDNFYSSPDLFTSLLNVGIYACGTVRSNRKGLPPQLLPKIVKLPKHEFKVAQKDDVMACCWQDTKPVMVLSSFHDPDAVGTVNRRSGNSQQQRVRVPKAIEDYQRHMKGVDLFDQMVGYYMPNHRSRKWWRRLFHHMQMSAAHNAYIIARDSNPEVIQREWPQFQDFVEDLAEDLIGNYKASRAAPLTNIENLPPVPREQHEIKSKLFIRHKKRKFVPKWLQQNVKKDGMISALPPAFTAKEERQLVERLTDMASNGYGYTRPELFNLATDWGITLHRNKQCDPQFAPSGILASSEETLM